MASWKSKWNLTWRQKIKSIDCILLLGFRDWVPKELQRVGCVELLNTVQRRVRPKLHVFGGIHEGKTGRKEFTTCWVIIRDLIHSGDLSYTRSNWRGGFQTLFPSGTLSWDEILGETHIYKAEKCFLWSCSLLSRVESKKPPFGKPSTNPRQFLESQGSSEECSITTTCREALRE